MLDLTEMTFVPELVRPAKYNGTALAHGCVLDIKFEAGRPGVAGEYRPEIRIGAGDHADIFVRVIDLSARPQINDVLQMTADDGELEDYRVRGYKGPQGGSYRLLCEKVGTRLVNTDKKGSGGMKRIY